jgi:lysophospholipid acyltransferase 7
MMLSSEDAQYVTMLIACLPLSWLASFAPPGPARKWFCSTVGLSMCLIMCGHEVLMALPLVLFAWLIIALVPMKHCPTVVFFVIFGSVTGLRVMHVYVGTIEAGPFTNCLLLLLSLKLVSIACDYRDSIYAERLSIQGIDAESHRFKQFRTPEVDLLSMLHYSFNFIGIFTGPFCTYRTYKDFIDNRIVVTFRHKRPEMISRLKYFLVIVPIFVLFKDYNADYVMSEKFTELWFPLRVLYMFPLFTVFRVRMYAGWILAEVGVVLSGLGAYPLSSKPTPGNGPTDELAEVYEGPVNQKHDHITFITVSNTNIVQVETMLSPQEGMRCWNMCVQWWLLNYIYRNCPIRSIRKPMTFFVSALWHGVRSGYFLSFLTVPIFNYSVKILEKRVRPRINHVLYVCMAWLLTNQYWNYLNMAFYLLSGTNTLYFWSQIYFLYHIIAVIIIFADFLYAKFARKPRSHTE